MQPDTEGDRRRELDALLQSIFQRAARAATDRIENCMTISENLSASVRRTVQGFQTETKASVEAYIQRHYKS